jgi:hypothetical protein
MSFLDSLKEFVDSCVTNLAGEVVPNPTLDYGEVAIKGAAVLDVINARHKLMEALQNPNTSHTKLDELTKAVATKGEAAQKITEIDFNPVSNFLDWLSSWLCLASGTLIRTPSGQSPVEELQIGDLVLTPDGPQPLKFLGISTRHVNILKASGRMPIRIQAGAFGDNLPSADIYCTPSHAFALGDCLVEAQALINGQSIYQLEELSEYDQHHQIKQGSLLAEQKEADFFTYYSLEFEQHALVWANDLLTESYLPTYRNEELTRVLWNNYENYLSLYGTSETMDELPMPRIPFARQLPLRIREQFGLVSTSYGPSSADASRDELCLTL